MKIDLRSDTVTKPTREMLEAMFSAQVGDDVFGEDPTVNKLEEKAASIFGKEAALFCPSGTMSNQISVKVLTQPQDEVICERYSHIYNFEAGGLAFNSGISARLISGDRGRISAVEIAEEINPHNDHYAHTSLVSLENTSNRGGGSFYSLSTIKEIYAVCRKNNLKLHLDGARIFNALCETKDTPDAVGKYFDTISVCLSKGLGTPAGSLVLSSTDNIKKARRVRKVMGGGMRQAGYFASAGIYALDHHVGRLKEDHRRAKALAEIIMGSPHLEELMPADTNIIIFRLSPSLRSEVLLQKLTDENILAIGFGKQTIRMVTHLDFTDDMLDKTIKVLRKLLYS